MSSSFSSSGAPSSEKKSNSTSSIYNIKNPAIRRIQGDLRELQRAMQHTNEYHAAPLEDNLFEWHFTIRGSPDSDFYGGKFNLKRRSIEISRLVAQ